MITTLVPAPSSSSQPNINPRGPLAASLSGLSAARVWVGRSMSPAMMWNTAHGMMRTLPQSSLPSVTPDQALRIADQWLTQNRPGSMPLTPSHSRLLHPAHSPR